MAIDASIISSGLRPPAPINIEDPISMYAKGLQLKTLMGQQQLQGLQTQQAQQGLEDSAAAREAYKASVDPTTGTVDQGALLKNLAGRGAVTAYQAASKSFLDADKARADIKKANSEVLTHKITAYKSLLDAANTPEDLAALYSAQYKDPDLGPILQQRGSLEDQLQHIPKDPIAFRDFKIKAEKGMSGFAEQLQKQADLALRERGQNMTYNASMYGHQVTAQGNQIKENPLGLNLNPQATVPVPDMPPSVIPGAGMPTPGGMPPAGGGFRGNMNAPELPAMRTAVSAPLAPTQETPGNAADLAAAQRGLANARTPAERAAYQDAIASITADMQRQGGSGGAPVAGGMPAPGQAPAAPVAAPVAAPAAPTGHIDLTQHGEDLLKQLPPNIAAQVKALAEGRMAFPTGAAFRSPVTQQILSLVGAYDPTFDAVNYQARNKTRSSLAAGQIGQNLTKINTAIGHLDSFDKAAEALNNSDYPLFNKLYNAIVPEVGGTETAGKIRTFQQAKEAVANELMAVFRGTGASSTDTAKWAETLNSADSPAALKAAVRGAVDLLDSRIGAVKQQYQTGMGTTEDPLQMVYPKAQATLDRLRGGGKSAQVVDSLPDPAQYKWKFAHGDGGISYQSDGTKWVRVKN